MYLIENPNKDSNNPVSFYRFFWEEFPQLYKIPPVLDCYEY